MLYRARAKVHIGTRAGFTLIELLVVIVLLGILMAVAIPTFQNAQEQGQASSAQSDLRVALNVAQGAYTYRADGTYPGTTALVTELENSEDDLAFVAMALDGTALTALEAAAVSATPSYAVTAPAAGSVGVQVFNHTSAGTTAVAAGSATGGNALALAREDVSRDQTVWWIVSNRDDSLAQASQGTFYGSDSPDADSWRPNQ